MRPLHTAAVDAPAAARPDAPALVEAGTGRRLTFGEVREASRRRAGGLAEEGIRSGDRVAVVLPQHPEAALVHVACSRLGAVSTPLSALFGPDGLAARLADARPKIVVTHARKAPVVREALALAGLDAPVRLVEDAPWRDAAPPEDRPARADHPMFLVYTSGTTGGPKGALLPHRVLDGRMTGFLLAHEPFGDAVFFSPADWSWIGGLLDALFAPWTAGGAVVAEARHGPFDPASTARLLDAHGVTDAFFPPTALKALARSGAPPPAQKLRAVHSAGEPLAPAVRAWAEAHLADAVTEVYGLTEAAFLVGTATRAYATPDGTMGRPYPGHRVRLADGEVAVEPGDPTLMLGYWQGEGRPPRLPLEGGLFRTGDLAEALPDGSLRFLGRADDLIKTSGYRVGPAEVEAALLAHPAVAEAAVVGEPDPDRGQVVVAYVKPVQAGDDALAAELQAFVRTRLAAHAYPRRVVFVDHLPTTVTGKLRRRGLRGQGL